MTDPMRVVEVLWDHRTRPTGAPFCVCGWRPPLMLNDTDSDRRQHVAHQAQMLEDAGVVADDPIRRAQAEALREAADAWTQGAWAKTPRRSGRVADRMAASQYAGDWLRVRADEIECGGNRG